MENTSQLAINSLVVDQRLKGPGDVAVNESLRATFKDHKLPTIQAAE